MTRCKMTESNEDYSSVGNKLRRKETVILHSKKETKFIKE